jgi:hypothetical protein
VERLVEGLRGMFQPLAGQGPGLRGPAEHARHLFTDRQRLEQILKNLLSNAIKFTERGQVSLNIGYQAGTALPSPCATPASALPPISSRHLRSLPPGRWHHQPPLRRHRPGPVDLARPGACSAADQRRQQPGQGSVFTLILPSTTSGRSVEPLSLRPAVDTRPCAAGAGGGCAKRPAGVCRRPRAAPFGNRCILVVEDEPNFARILYDLAHELGYSCLVAHGADEGFDLAAQYIPMRSCWTCACPTIPA